MTIRLAVVYLEKLEGFLFKSKLARDGGIPFVHLAFPFSCYVLKDVFLYIPSFQHLTERCFWGIRTNTRIIYRVWDAQVVGSAES